MSKRFHYAWVIFICTCVLSLVGFGLVINTVGLFYTPLEKEFNIGRGEVALMSTFQNLAAAVTLLFAGKVMSKFNIKMVLGISYLVIGGGLISLSMMHSILPFYIAWTFIGIAQPFAIILPIPVLLGNWFEKSLGTVMGIALGISALGGAAFNPIISSIITSAGWRTGYVVTGAIVLVTMLPLALFVIKSKPKNGMHPYGHTENITVEKSGEETGILLKDARKTPEFYLLAFSMIALNYVAGFIQHISGHIVNVGLPLTIGASVVSGVMLGAAAGKICIGWMLDKFSHSVVIIIYSVLGAIGWGGLAAMKHSGILVSCGFILGIGQGILLVSLPYFIRRIFGQKDYSNIYSILSMFGAISSAAAVSLDGRIFDITKSYSIPLWMNAILYIASAFAIICAVQKATAKKKAQKNPLQQNAS